MVSRFGPPMRRLPERVAGPEQPHGPPTECTTCCRGLPARFNGVGSKRARSPLHSRRGDGRAQTAHPRRVRSPESSFSPDGSVVAFVADRRAGHDDRQWRSDVWVVPVMGGAPRRLTNGKGFSTSPLFSPDGELIAFTGTASERWDLDSHLFVVAGDGSSSPERVAPETDLGVLPRLAGMPAAHRWTGDRALAVLVTHRGGVAMHRARIGEGHTRELVGGGTEIDFFAAQPNRRTVVFSSAWVDRPFELFALASTGSRPVQLTHFHDDLIDEVELSPAHRFSLSRPDGTELEYFTLLPPGGREHRLPVHLDIHGGPNGWWPLARGSLCTRRLRQRATPYSFPTPGGAPATGNSSARPVPATGVGPTVTTSLPAATTWLPQGLEMKSGCW